MILLDKLPHKYKNNEKDNNVYNCLAKISHEINDSKSA